MAEFLIIAGRSGAGRSEAAKSLDDLGWFVIDNLPTPLISKSLNLRFLQALQERILL